MNLDDFADEDLEVPPRSDPSITLSDLRAVLNRPILLPLGTEAVHLDEKDYRLVDGYLPHAVRVTVDREFYEMHIRTASNSGRRGVQRFQIYRSTGGSHFDSGNIF